MSESRYVDMLGHWRSPVVICNDTNGTETRGGSRSQRGVPPGEEWRAEREERRRDEEKPEGEKEKRREEKERERKRALEEPGGTRDR